MKRKRILETLISFVLCLVLLIILGMNIKAKAEGLTQTAYDGKVYIGDVDDDGKVTLKDVSVMRRHLADGWGVEIDTEDGDVDQDGSITPKDVTMLRRYLVGGWGVELPEKKTGMENSLLRIVYMNGTEAEIDVAKDKIEINGEIEKIYFGIYPQTEEYTDGLYEAEYDRFQSTMLDGSRYTRRKIDGGTRYYKWDAIEWRVVQIEDGENGKRMLLVADSILDTIPFNETSETVMWEDSDIRSWLNGEFYHNAFGGGAWKAVSTGSVSSKRSDGSTYETNDRVFLLSLDEAETYEYNGSSVASFTFNQNMGMGATSKCWYRDGYLSNERYQDILQINRYDSVPGNLTNCYGVRPAVWISLEGPTEDVSGDPAGMKILGRQQEQNGHVGSNDLSIECRYVNEAGVTERKIQYYQGRYTIAKDLGYLELDYWYDEQGKKKKYYVNSPAVGGMRLIETEYDSEEKKTNTTVTYEGTKGNPYTEDYEWGYNEGEWLDYQNRIKIVYKDGTEKIYDTSKDRIDIAGEADIEKVYFGIYPQTEAGHIYYYGALPSGYEPFDVTYDSLNNAEYDRFQSTMLDGSRYTRRKIDGGTRYYKWDAIEWRVVQIEDGENGKRMLLVADSILDTIPFNETSEAVTWEDSDIRSWLNGEFYHNAFGGGAWKAVSTGSVISKRSDGSTYETNDRVFLLSLDEAETYEYNGSTVASFTFVNNTDMGSTSRCWYRDGYLSNEGYQDILQINRYDSVPGNLTNCYGVRPAVWISLEGPTEDVSGDPAGMKILGRQQEQNGHVGSNDLSIECRYVNEAGVTERKIQYYQGRYTIAGDLGYLEYDHMYDSLGKEIRLIKRTDNGISVYLFDNEETFDENDEAYGGHIYSYASKNSDGGTVQTYIINGILVNRKDFSDRSYEENYYIDMPDLKNLLDINNITYKDNHIGTCKGKYDSYGNCEIKEYGYVKGKLVQTGLRYKGASGGEAYYKFRYDGNGILYVGYYFGAYDDNHRRTIILREFDEEGKVTGIEEIINPFVYFNAKATQYEVFWDDNLFAGSSYNNNKYIAMLSTALSDAAYRVEDITYAYQKLGFKFDDIETYNYGVSTLAYSIASKDFNSERDGRFGGWKLLVITLRGTDGFFDIMKDLQIVPIDAIGMANFNSMIPVHSGFYDYAMEVYSGLNQYLSAHPDVASAISADRCRILINGHSLGSGGGTVLGAYLNNHDFISEEFLHVYGIASPKTVTNWFNANGGKYKNIWNYVVDEDLVPALPSSTDWFGNVWMYDTCDMFRLRGFDAHSPTLYYDVIRDSHPIMVITP